MDRQSDLTLDAILARYENPNEVLTPHYKNWIENASSRQPNILNLMMPFERFVLGEDTIIAQIMRDGIDETPEFARKLFPNRMYHEESEEDWRVYEWVTGKIHPGLIEYDPYSFAFGDNNSCDCCGRVLNPLNRSPFGYLCRECDGDNIASYVDEQEYDDLDTPSLPSQSVPAWF